MAAWSLTPVDNVEVTILVDNVSDALLATTPIATRPGLDLDSDRDHMLAEHGYSLLISVDADGDRQTILYDAGLTRKTAVHNLDVLQQSIRDLRAIVLSHGHADHHGGLAGVIGRVGRRGMPLILHPDAWLERKIVFPDGTEIAAPPPSHMDLDREGVEVIEERGPTLLLDNHILISGQVERVTDFEPGSPSSSGEPEPAGSPIFLLQTTRE